MPVEKILVELDREQRMAATVEQNTVVAAGAGSGKTKVLAARYAWLVMEKKIPVEEILTLTFTNKAVSEMYSRIYDLLNSEKDNAEARRGIANFHRANISTIDAFSAQIARTAARRYGISPGFAIDDPGVRELAMQASLPFVLEHRNNPSLQLLLADKKIKVVAEELFSETVLRHSPISTPLDFSRFLLLQNNELLRQWKRKTAEVSDMIHTLREELEMVSKTSGKFYTTLKELFQKKIPLPPEMENLLQDTHETDGALPLFHSSQSDHKILRREFAEYFLFLFELKTLRLPGNSSDEFSIIKETINTLRPLYDELESLANMGLQNHITASVFPLVDEFQKRFNREKREAGILSFNDIAHLAVDALARYPDIRQVFKDSYRAIMIDEFQDNNRLQRDLVYLLAEKLERDAPGIPGPNELSPDKLFFVGDEKQSIYRFRGADVSVFRLLAKDLAAGEEKNSSLSLIHNYRSRPILIEAFNRIFGGDGFDGEGVFLRDSPALPDFEAVYSRLQPREAPLPEDLQNPGLHFCFLQPEDPDKKDPQTLSNDELEAAFIAAKIRELVDGKYEITVREQGKTLSRACTYGDFAVLQRSYSHQQTLEKQCKLFGVRFTADRPAGLFNDAPVNDLCQLLRLLAYPADRLSYAALIRSPFVRLSDRALTVCLLDDTNPDTGLPRPPFDKGLDEKIPAEDRALYRDARRRFEALQEAARTLTITELLSKLWFDEGYRYETLWSGPAQIYGELFDLFFEIARKADMAGKTLPGFIDYLSALMSLDEQPDDLEVPPEGEETGVRLMSIHKSKGLEFPLVFVYGCGNRGASQRNDEPFFFSQEWGITINLPAAEELPGGGGNYFYEQQKKLEKAKAEAELRRLLYVAMTRAESALYITASLPPQTNDEAKESPRGEVETETPEDFIWERISQLAVRKKEGALSFLDLLLPVIADCEDPPFTVEAIPVLSRQELRRMATKTGEAVKLHTMIEAAEKAAPLYAGTETVPAPPPALGTIPASSLHYTPPGMTAAPATEIEDSALDRLLKQSGLEAADFGTIAHSYIEAHIRNRAPLVPPRILAKVDESRWPLVHTQAAFMRDRFFSSDLGQICLGAAYREAEFPILTMINREGKTIPVSGTIDLLFELAGTMFVADFKTDRIENPMEHLAQLAVYAQAVSDIFDRPVRSWLFYLRGGKAVELTGDIEKVDMAAL